MSAAPLFEAFRPKREISEAAQRALDAGIPVRVRKGVEYVYVNEATAGYLDNPPAPYFAPLLCRCPQREYPHELSIHALIRYEWWNRELRNSWPWSLMASSREEPSTEREAA